MLSVSRTLLLATALLANACTTPKDTVSSRPPSYPWFPFNWYSTTLAGKRFDKAAITVPIKLNGLQGNFITQFDLGSDATLLYENSIKNYFASRAQLYALADTTQLAVSDNGTNSYPTTGLAFSIGSTSIPHPWLRVKEGDPVPKDSLHTASKKLVGTIGSDFLKGKVLVIDYPQRRMCVLDSVDKYWRARTTFVSSQVKNNRMHIPLTIQERTYWELFDTGASLFPISTDFATWQQLVGPRLTPTDTLQVPSWGEQVTFYGAPMQHDAYLGKLRLPKSNAWFTRNQRLLNFNAHEKIDALTGNTFFVRSIVVLDFKTSRFGVVN